MALITVAILLFLTNPSLLEEIWLWIIGLIGYIVLMLEKGVKALTSVVSTKPNSILPTPPSYSTFPINQLPLRIDSLERKLEQKEEEQKIFQSSDITVLRYLDDGFTSLGLIFFKQKFFAYTLEDTFRSEKLAGKTRIPSGTYRISFRKQDTPLTEKYRQRFSWFTYHLELNNVPNFSNIYIHVGNTHVDTDGCILVADGVNISSSDKIITHSRLAFERLYKKIKALLQIQEVVTIRIIDEDWFEQFQPQPV